jgi:hypothetical protein
VRVAALHRWEALRRFSRASAATCLEGKNAWKVSLLISEEILEELVALLTGEHYGRHNVRSKLIPFYPTC